MNAVFTGALTWLRGLNFGFTKGRFADKRFARPSFWAPSFLHFTATSYIVQTLLLTRQLHGFYMFKLSIPIVITRCLVYSFKAMEKYESISVVPNVLMVGMYPPLLLNLFSSQTDHFLLVNLPSHCLEQCLTILM